MLGGGRYDGLSEAIGGPKAPGIGFAMGEDRLVLTLQSLESAPPQVADAYIAPLGENLNPAALALAIAKLATDPTLRDRMGQAGMQRVHEHFTVQHMVRAHEELYRGLMM